MNRLVNNITTILSSIVLFSVINGCESSTAENEQKNKTTSVPDQGIPAIMPLQGSFTGQVTIPGELQAYQQVDLYAKISSFVSKLYVDVGSEVKAGQLLAMLEAPEMNAQLNAASSRLKSQEALYIASKATYDRLLKTSETPGTISANDLEQANARVQSDLAQLDAAKAAYREVSDTRNYLQIRAPFSGTIAARNVSAGAYVGPSGKGSDLPIFTLVQQNKIRLVANLPESYTGNLDKNGEVKFTIQSIPADTFTAKIARAAGALDNRLRSQRVEMDVQNTDKKLLPGMVAEIVLPLQSNKASLSVPSTAVLNSTTGIFVIKVQDGKAKWVPVTAGNSNGERTQVVGNLLVSDTLVKNATEEIRDGQDVKVKMEK